MPDTSAYAVCASVTTTNHNHMLVLQQSGGVTIGRATSDRYATLYEKVQKKDEKPSAKEVQNQKPLSPSMYTCTKGLSSYLTCFSDL